MKSRLLGIKMPTRRGRWFATSTAAAMVATATLGATQASAENVQGWWPYNGIQSTWHCGQTQQVFGNDYARACVSVNGESAQAVLVLNTGNDPTAQWITGNVQDDINAVDQGGEDRTCGVGVPTPVGYDVCYAHTMTVPHGTDFGAWITLKNGYGQTATLYWSVYT